VEGWEWCVLHDDGVKMIIPLVAVGDSVVEVGQGVDHVLHLVIAVTHREVTLDEVAECGIKVKRARFAIANEQVLDRAPDLARGDVVLLNDVLKFTGDHVEDSGEDDSLCAIPGRVVDGWSVGEDVVGEFVALQDEQNLIAPLGVACRSRIQNNQDKRANVLYPAGMHVQHGDIIGVTLGGWGWWHALGGCGGRC
jgi:hypothetical protein